MYQYEAYNDPIQRPRYTGLPTFMRAPYREDYEGLDIALVGVPFDGGVTNRTGARHGPREIRNQSSLMRRRNQANGIGPHDLCSVADVGDAWVQSPFHLEKSLDEICHFYERLHSAGAVPLPILRAIAKDEPVGLIHFDAHCDTGDDYLGSKFHHGAPFRRAVEEGLIDPLRTIQIGIRGTLNDLDQWKFSHDAGMRVIYMDEFYELGVKAVIEEIHRVAGEGPCYLTFDVDGLDPVYASGTGTPEVGGFSTVEAQLMIRGCQGLNLIGGDVVEVAPPFDPSGNTALTGATMMFEILCVVADALAARRSV